MSLMDLTGPTWPYLALPVGDGVHDGHESVDGDDHHDEAGEVEADDPDEDHDPAGEVIRPPGHCVGPPHLKRHLEQDHLRRS